MTGYYLPTTMIFIGYSMVTLIYTLKNAKEKRIKRTLVNELVLGFLFLFAGLTFPFLYQFHSPRLTINSLNSMWLLTSLILMLEMVVWAATLIYNSIISKRDADLMAERDYEKYRRKVLESWVDDLKGEFGRKFLHVFTSSVIFIFWSIGTILGTQGFLDLVGLDVYSFSYWWIVTVGFAFVIMFQIADLTRLNRSYMLPNWARKWYLAMRPDELDTFVASTPLVLAFVPFIFAPFPIFASVALITTVADGLACIIGKKYGKHQLKRNSNKTIEGLIAGGSSTFIIAILMMVIYQSWLELNIMEIILMAFVAMLIFMIIDVFITIISDNILNPLLTGLGMWIVFLII